LPILADRTNGRAYATALRPSAVYITYGLWLIEKLSEEANRIWPMGNRMVT